jgi:hypothetical protein
MSGHIGVALILVLFGLPGAAFPYKVAKFGEMLDAIGSKRRSSEVEPAAWNVTLTRIGSLAMVLFGVLFGAGLIN